jgi:ornithine cyclodeaminase/alanine dehydrogenase
MASHRLLYLSRQEVIDCGPGLAESIDIIEGVLREHGLGEVENPPKPGVHTLADAFIHAMPGYLKRPRQVGLKWVSGYFSNPQRGLASISGLIVLNDPDTGLPTAVMDCTYVTALRTAAVSGVAARHLARTGSATLGIVGAGLQGRYNLLTLKQVLPALQRVRVFDTAAATLAKFVPAMAELTQLAVEPAASAEQAVIGADVVVTATGWLDEPIFRADWVAEGALVLPIHARGWERRMLEEADKFIVDDFGQFSASMGGPGGFYDPLPQPYAELGQIVLGAKPGREADAERIIDFNYGMAVHDVALASEVLARAREKGVGTELPQMDGVLPFSQ